MMREDYSEALVEELLLEIDAQQSHVDQEAEKRFYDALGERPGYIDVEAFHKAYDALIEDAGMTDIFNENGIIAGKWLYGRIKECTNAQAARALKRLWVAQYVDRLKTSTEIELQKAAETAAAEKAKKAEEETKRKQQAARDAAAAAKEKALQALDSKTIDAYKAASKSADIADDIYIEPRFGYGSNEAVAEGYYLELKGGLFYRLRPEDLGNTQLIAKYISELIKAKLKEDDASAVSDFSRVLLQELGIDGIRCEAVYLIIDGSLYKVSVQHTSAEHSNYALEVEKGGSWTAVTKDSLPAKDAVRVAAITETAYHRKTTTYLRDITHIYYNPTLSSDILDKCDILPEDPGSGNVGYYTEVKNLPMDDIPVEARAVGLTAGQSQVIESDTGD